ncbi:MAG: hypothetical protein J5602_10295 [Clostridia bacterium]|nr:hypothetical protein [Clostridia bacterium]
MSTREEQRRARDADGMPARAVRRTGADRTAAVGHSTAGRTIVWIMRQIGQSSPSQWCPARHAAANPDATSAAQSAKTTKRFAVRFI